MKGAEGILAVFSSFGATQAPPEGRTTDYRPGDLNIWVVRAETLTHPDVGRSVGQLPRNNPRLRHAGRTLTTIVTVVVFTLP